MTLGTDLNFKTDSASLLGFGGSIVDGISAFGSGRAEARLARMNAGIALENARQAETEGSFAAEQNDQQIAALLGTQEAAQGASGLAIDSKTSKSLRDSSRQLGRQDSLNLRYKGAKEARNFEIQAQDFEQRSANARRKGTNALLKSYLAGSVGLIGSSKAVRKASLFVPVPSKRPRRFT